MTGLRAMENYLQPLKLKGIANFCLTVLISVLLWTDNFFTFHFPPLWTRMSIAVFLYLFHNCLLDMLGQIILVSQVYIWREIVSQEQYLDYTQKPNLHLDLTYMIRDWNLSWYYNSMRCLGTLGRGKCILHVDYWWPVDGLWKTDSKVVPMISISWCSYLLLQDLWLDYSQ